MYILNQTGSSSVQCKTPYDLFAEKAIHLNKFHVFGTDCFVHVPQVQRKNWDSKGKRGVFVGYTDDVDGYRIWIKSENYCIVRSKNVIFEPEEPGKTVSLFPVEINDDRDITDFTNVSSDNNAETSVRQLRNRALIKAPERIIETMIAEIDEPRSYAEALKSAECLHWKAAMDEEMESLTQNSTWSLVELPTMCKAISNRWVYRIKRDAEGEILRYKARLVARGFTQRKEVHYTTNIDLIFVVSLLS